eukprot:1652717-Rhodomonas_salina.1
MRSDEEDVEMCRMCRMWVMIVVVLDDDVDANDDSGVGGYKTYGVGGGNDDVRSVEDGDVGRDI